MGAIFVLASVLIYEMATEQNCNIFPFPDCITKMIDEIKYKWKHFLMLPGTHVDAQIKYFLNYGIKPVDRSEDF